MQYHVRLPKVYLWGGVICAAVFGILLTISLAVGEAIAIVVGIFGFFLLIGLWLIVEYLFWRIEFDENSFIFRNGLGKKRKYLYSDVLEVDQQRKVMLHFTGRKIAIVRTCPGLERFVECIGKARTDK